MCCSKEKKTLPHSNKSMSDQRVHRSESPDMPHLPNVLT